MICANISYMTDIVMPEPDTRRNQRVVLEHTQGPYAGLKQITGHSDELDPGPPPTMTEEFDITPGKRRGIAGLVKSTPRYLLYREITKPDGLGTFDRRQR